MSNKKGGYGKVATTKKSRATDLVVKTVFPEAVKEINQEYCRELTHVTKFSSEFFGKTSKGQNKGLQPDGGCILDESRTVIMCGEAKYNGKGGNAIERWFYNSFRLRVLFPDISYLTFGSGDVSEFSPMRGTLYVAHHGDFGSFDKFTPCKNSAFLKESWSHDEVKMIVKNSLIELLGLKLEGEEKEVFKLKKSLQKELNDTVKNQNFERAIEIRDELKKLENL